MAYKNAVQGQLRESNTPTVENHTADDTLTANESGSLHTNTGAAGTVKLTLPAATAGLEFRFVVGAAQALRIDPNGSETFKGVGAIATAAGKYLQASAIGDSLHVKCAITGSWSILGQEGAWSVEA